MLICQELHSLSILFGTVRILCKCTLKADIAHCSGQSSNAAEQK